MTWAATGLTDDTRPEHTAVWARGRPPVLEVDRRPCSRCGRLEHVSPFDDPLPPAPAVEAGGETYVHLSVVLAAIGDIWSRPVMAFRRTVEVEHDRWVRSRPDLYPDGCPSRCLIHQELPTARRAAA